MKSKSISLRICLIKSNVQADKVIKNDANFKKYDISKSLEYSGDLFVMNPSQKSPRWMEFVNSCVTDPIENIINRSNGVLLVISVGNRIFAISFGLGHHLINSDYVVDDFGIKVTLNAVDPDKLRSIDAKTIDERIMNYRHNSSRLSSVESFGINTFTDIIKGVAGIPKDETLANWLVGSDALRINARISSTELGHKCRELLKEYKKKEYQERFGWIDKLRPVKDKNVIEKLEQELLSALKERAVENIFLAPPGVINWDDVRGFSIKPFNKRKERQYKHDLLIEDFWEKLDDLADISIERIKSKDKVFIVKGDQEIEDEISLFKCIVFEVKTRDHLYILTEGEWYIIDKDLESRVNREVMSIQSTKLKLPYAKNGEYEKDYNNRASSAEIALMDRKNIQILGRSPIEFCDLFSRNKDMIHVKGRARSSSTLSHLFSQGKVSAINFMEEHAFRKAVKEKLPLAFRELIPENGIGRDEFRVVYAIITGIKEKDWQLKLPFFSRLNLGETAKELRRYGYKVGLQKINKTGDEK